MPEVAFASCQDRVFESTNDLAENAWSLTTDSTRRLEEEVAARLHGRMRNLRIYSTETGLILRGIAPSYYIKQLAQHAVMAESLIPIEANEIAVAREAIRRSR